MGVEVDEQINMNINMNTNMNLQNYVEETYVYWTVHKRDSWIKIDQLDVTCFIISLFTAQHVCWCYGVVRLGWCGILMQAEAVLQPA